MSPHSFPSALTPPARRRILWQTLLVLVLACGLFLLDARNTRLHHDEAYTILAARSWLADGTFRIWQGEYLRVKGYTVLVAWSLAAFGDTLLAARLPSVIAAALLVAFTFFWTRRQVSAAAAWTAATLLCFSSFVIGISHYARFYALHGLLFWVGAIALYAVFPDVRRAPAKLALLAVAGAVLAGAHYLQPVTLLGVVGLATWAVLDSTFRKGVLEALWRAEWRAVTTAAAFIAVLALFLVFDLPETLKQLYTVYRWAPPWIVQRKWEHDYYLTQFARDLPLLLYLFPLAALLAATRAPRPTLFCLVTALVPLVLHSFAAFKGHRFVYYTYPFLFVVWAIAIDALLPLIRESASRAYGQAVALLVGTRTGNVPEIAARAPAARVVAVVLGGVIATIALAGNPDFSTVRSVPAHLFALARGEDPTAAKRASEAKTRDALLELMDGGGLVLTSDDVITLYYLGRFDALLRPSGLGVSQPGREVDRDTRTGAPIIRSGETLRRVLACHPKGLTIVWSHEWRVAYGVTPELADIIEAEMQELKLPGTLKVRAFRWNGDSSSGVICRPDYGGLQVPTAEVVPHTMSGSK